ncbi:MAG: peptidylprolyl isomerase, partial [Bacteroidota bacterium]
DTTVTEDELVKYYNANKENFKATGTLAKLRYIKMAKDHPKFNFARQKFSAGGKKDIKALNDMAIQFKSYAFNDSVWTDMNDIYQKLPFIKPDNRDKYISGGISYQYPDSLDVYLVKVSKVIDRNQVAPYEYIRPTIKQLIINNRKLELIKKFQKEITDDALKDKKYEIYK